MSRQLARLISVYRDLSDRYGIDDPLMVEFRQDVERRQHQNEVLPHGERRKVNLAPHLWNQRLRHLPRTLRERPAP